MGNKTWYLAGPMTGRPKFNFDVFNSVMNALREQGYTIVSPFEINAMQHQGDVPETDEARLTYLRNDLIALLGCTGVILLPGWKMSNGASLEYRIATALDMNVLFVEENGQLL